MVVPVVERLERRGCYMMSRTGSGCPWREGSVRERRNMAELPSLAAPDHRLSGVLHGDEFKRETQLDRV